MSFQSAALPGLLTQSRLQFLAGQTLQQQLFTNTTRSHWVLQILDAGPFRKRGLRRPIPCKVSCAKTGQEQNILGLRPDPVQYIGLIPINMFHESLPGHIAVAEIWGSTFSRFRPQSKHEILLNT
jgi:hypothetical protein